MSWWLLGALTFGVWGLFVVFAWERRTVEPKDPAQDQVGVTVFKRPLKLNPAVPLCLICGGNRGPNR